MILKNKEYQDFIVLIVKQKEPAMKKISLFWMLLSAASLVITSGIHAQERSGLDWSQFDFVSGDEIIFEDNQEGERNGEFPSKWDLSNGTVENAVLTQPEAIWAT